MSCFRTSCGSQAPRVLFVLGIVLSFIPMTSFALDLDWSGQFRTESHWLYNYSLTKGNATPDLTRINNNGYYVPGSGGKNAFFQTLFMRLRPVVVVNDNIYIKSEWQVGDPVFGFFGDSAGQSVDQRQYYSTDSRGSFIKAQRFWAEYLSDIGTFQVGRVPLHWGLGLFWNSGDGIWDRYQSTGDAVRLVSKFGSFTFTPSIIKYSIGNNLGGGGNLSDYSIAFKYENVDEDLEMGLNYVKRIAAGDQDTSAGILGIYNQTVGNTTFQTSGSNINHWDIYGRKKLGWFSIAGEIPIVTGDIGGVEYRTWAIALEGGWQINDSWETHLKTGHIPGQPDSNAVKPSVYKAYFLNPNYNVGLIMFNYQLRSFAGPTTTNNPANNEGSLQSPFDNPIVNANYVNIGGSYSVSKWKFRGNFLFAVADETAGTGNLFFNHWSRTYVSRFAEQSSFLGWEMDYGTTFRWDDNFHAGIDLGFWFPGGFYQFDNTAGSVTDIRMVFATLFRAGIEF